MKKLITGLFCMAISSGVFAQARPGEAKQEVSLGMLFLIFLGVVLVVGIVIAVGLSCAKRDEEGNIIVERESSSGWGNGVYVPGSFDYWDSSDW